MSHAKPSHLPETLPSSFDIDVCINCVHTSILTFQHLLPPFFSWAVEQQLIVRVEQHLLQAGVSKGDPLGSLCSTLRGVVLLLTGVLLGEVHQHGTRFKEGDAMVLEARKPATYKADGTRCV